MKHLIIAIILLFILTMQASVFASNTQTNIPGTIVVSIKPLYSLVAHLTEGVTQPVLLMQQAQSAHHYNMRPSERRLLANADMIIWTGPQMETWLHKIIEQQRNATTIVSAMQAKNLYLLKQRNPHSHEHGKHSASARLEKQNRVDPHIWLSTHNAIAIARHISAELIRYNPENTEQYKKNLDALLDKIEQTKDFITANLTAKNAPFIVYHDAFQYFEHENALNYIDAINFNHETGTSLKHLRQIKRQINKHNIQCLVYQTPKPGIVDALTSQSSIKAVALEPLGLHVENDKNAWFVIMEQLALRFSYCLSY